MGVDVRRIRVGEGELIRTIRLTALLDAPSAFASTHAAESEMTEADWAARATWGADGCDRATFVACGADGQPVGLVGGHRTKEGVVELVSMWTAPEARGAGVGRALVAAVATWARSCGDATLHLWVTRGNDRAQRLYERAGFELDGAHKPLPSDPCKDELRMVLRL